MTPGSFSNGVMRLAFAVVAGLLALPSRAEPPSKEIAVRVSWLGHCAGDVLLIAAPSNRPTAVEGFPASSSSHFGEVTRMPRCPSFEIRVVDANGKPAPGPSVKVPPGSSEFVLFLHGDGALTTRAMLIPSDLATFGWGTSVFVNLSVNRLRCTLGGNVVELAPGEVASCALLLKSRKVVLLRTEYQNDGRWILNGSTPLILNEGVRVIFGVGPGDARDGVLPTDSLLDSNPALTNPARPAAETVTPAVTPLPDPPAK